MSAVVKFERLGLPKYDAMLRALVAATSADEVKNLRDQAQALQKYAAQANNVEAEQELARFRINAETKCGLLLKSSEKAKGGDRGGRKPKDPGSVRASNAQTKTLKEMGISETQSSR